MRGGILEEGRGGKVEDYKGGEVEEGYEGEGGVWNEEVVRRKGEGNASRRVGKEEVGEVKYGG